MRLPVIKGKLVNLRGLKRSDADSILKYADDHLVAKFLPLMPNPYSIKDANYWINLTQRQARLDKSYQFGIEYPETGEIIGGIGLKNINKIDLNAEVGYCLGRRYWKRGYSTEALSLILKFAFKELRLIRVYAIVHEKNTGSVKLLAKTGFTHEGTWRKASRMSKRWHDVYAYGILKDEFKPV